ncbi:MAG TPA: four helix bundle protein [Vicinamibacterales bacterium]|nr:four helix bundle protein [Vicinamibacterales bacterium]
MKARTHRFSVDVILFLDSIPDRPSTTRLKDQLAGAAGGLDLNWRAACRGRSHKEFTAKLGVVVEEADEAEGCLDTIWDSGLSTTDTSRRLRAESKELRAIFNKAERTARANEEATDRESRRRKRLS